MTVTEAGERIRVGVVWNAREGSKWNCDLDEMQAHMMNASYKTE